MTQNNLSRAIFSFLLGFVGLGVIILLIELISSTNIVPIILDLLSIVLLLIAVSSFAVTIRRGPVFPGRLPGFPRTRSSNKEQAAAMLQQRYPGKGTSAHIQHPVPPRQSSRTVDPRKLPNSQKR